MPQLSRWFKVIHDAARPSRARSQGTRTRCNQTASDTIEVGDFRIDCERRVVAVCGKAVSLTPAEFDVLVFLTGHNKSIVTPQTRLNSQYGGHKLRQAEFLRVLLSLRKKIQEVIEGDYIRTEPWVFYRFDAKAG